MDQQETKCPFQWQDRVDHDKFGFGVVNGEPTKTTNASDNPSWMIPVKWEDSGRSPCKISSGFLRLVDRPDAKGGAFWANEHQKLVDAVTPKLHVLEQSLKNSFRSKTGNGSARVEDAFRQMETALRAMQRFLKDDEAGKHP